MDDRNTIVIERNNYTNEVKYLWKNDVKNTLSDLSENNNSPFSSSSPDYKKFSTGLLTEIAHEVVRTIDEAYNKWGRGLHIEVNGTERDYLAIKNAIEKYFPDRHMDCTWNEHTQLPAETMPKIKSIYRNLKISLENDGKGIIELCDRNDEKGWLRFGFNREDIASEEALYGLCMGAGIYLEKVMAEVKDEADRSTEEVSRLERSLEQVRAQRTEESMATEAEIDIDQLSKIMKKICKKHTKEAGKEFEDLLKDSVEKKYLDENRITRLVRSAEDHVGIPQVEWQKPTTEAELIMQRFAEERRKKHILKILVDCLNKDMRQCVHEINSVGTNFGDKSIEKLKEEFLDEIYASKKFTDGQKDAVRRWVFSGERVDVSYSILKLEDQIGEDQFKWTKKTFEEKDVCKAYEKRLGKELKDKRDDVLNGNSKIFEKWGDAFLEMWKKQNSNTQSDSQQKVEQIRKKIKEYQEKRRKLASLQNIFQESRKKIDALISFRKG